VIIALDLAQRMGVAVGAAGVRPSVSVVDLKSRTDPRAVAGSNLISYLDNAIRHHRPGMIVIEAPLALQGFRTLGNAAATVRMAHGLAEIAAAMAYRFGVPFHEVHVATVRKHFIGSSGAGERSATKAAVVARCHMLGYLPRHCHEENMADACAVFDYASAVLVGKPLPIVLFGATAA
jgi:Holliday junction resolvasome RuvABC endonuclease subunit